MAPLVPTNKESKWRKRTKGEKGGWTDERTDGYTYRQTDYIYVWRKETLQSNVCIKCDCNVTTVEYMYYVYSKWQYLVQILWNTGTQNRHLIATARVTFEAPVWIFKEWRTAKFSFVSYWVLIASILEKIDHIFPLLVNILFKNAKAIIYMCMLVSDAIFVSQGTNIPQINLRSSFKIQLQN